MKRIFNILLIIMMLSVVKVQAAGSVTVSTGSVNLQPGGSKTITITASNAAGRIDISSSDTSVATVSKSSEWIENGSIKVTIKAVSEGIAKINVKLTDVATFDGKVLSGTKTVTVTSKKAVADKTDATLNKLSVENYKIEFNKNTLNYTLEVPNNVTSLKINANPSSSAAKVSIGKADELKLGENTIKIVVTAGNGTKKEYTLKVIRKDDIPEATLTDLETVIKNTTKDTIALKLTKETKITNEVINILKNSNKNAILNKYNDEGIVEYSLILDNDLISSQQPFDASVSFEPNNKEEVAKSINYSEGIYMKLDTNQLVNGKIKVYVADKYTDNHTLNVLSYKDNQTKLLGENVKVENGYVTFDLTDDENYVLTRASLTSNIKTDKEKSANLFMVIAITELMGLVGLGSFTFIKLKK